VISLVGCKLATRSVCCEGMFAYKVPPCVTPTDRHTVYSVLCMQALGACSRGRLMEPLRAVGDRDTSRRLVEPSLQAYSSSRPHPKLSCAPIILRRHMRPCDQSPSRLSQLFPQL
jgi:hypothetical protein